MVGAFVTHVVLCNQKIIEHVQDIHGDISVLKDKVKQIEEHPQQTIIKKYGALHVIVYIRATISRIHIDVTEQSGTQIKIYS